MGVGGGWEAEGGQYHPQGDKQQCCVFSIAQKQPQSPGRPRRSRVINQQQFDTGPTGQAALLVPISGPIDSVVDRRGFTGSSKDRL